MPKIKEEHEDILWNLNIFIQKVQGLLDTEFEKKFQELKADGFCDTWESEREAKDYVFDYIYNDDTSDEPSLYFHRFGAKIEGVEE